MRTQAASNYAFPILRIRSFIASLLLGAFLPSCQCEALRMEQSPASAPSALVVASAPSSSPAPPVEAEPVPAPPPPPPAPKPVPRGVADLDPDNDDVVAPPDPIEDCSDRLKALGVDFKVAELPLKKRRGSKITCGSANAVVYSKGPGNIRYVPSPLLDCGMALALAHAEPILQEEAEKHLGAKILRISQMGTYSCRGMAAWNLVSEHSYANAIDLKAFRLTDGRKVSILSHFGKPEKKPERAEGKFLRAAARRLYDENVFSVVLTSFFDKLHRDHFHVDLARYRVDGTR